MADPGELLIRADGDASRGLGHLMRGLALGHAWAAAGGRVALATAGGTEGVEAELNELAATVLPVAGPAGSVADAEATRAAAADRGVAWLAVDGEQFAADYLAAVRAPGTRVLHVDDFGRADSGGVDLVLNQNLGASADLYPGADRSRLLLGPEHIMLRPAFLAVGGRGRSPVADARHLLVFLGGSDPDGSTALVVDALGALGPDWRIEVVVGAHARPPAAAEDDPRFRLLAGVDDMAGLMAACDLAVVAAGGALWELLFMEVVTLSFSRNPRQRQVVDELGDRGALVALGAPGDLDPARLVAEVEALAADPGRRGAMTSVGRVIVDGRGARRVVDAMGALTDG